MLVSKSFGLLGQGSRRSLNWQRQIGQIGARARTRSPGFGGLQTIVRLMYAHVAKGPHQQPHLQHVEGVDLLLKNLAV